MAGVITTSSFAKALYPGLSKIYGQAYNEYPVEYTDLFSVHKSKRAWEEEMGTSGFGLPVVKPEGQGITYDTTSQAFLTRYTHATYALGFIVTREMFDDDLYGVVAPRRARELAFSMRQGKETVAANIINRAFNSSYTGGDSKELCATDHPNWAGGTWANEPSTATDLSEAALEQACIDIGKWTNDRGLKISVQAVSLHGPIDLMFEAERILKTPYRVGTADNDINALNKMGKFSGGFSVNHYFTDTDAWFIKTNVPDGLKFWVRNSMTFAVDNDFDTENAKFKATERYSVGWTNPRGIYGSPGA